jgi:hypothetical protein
MCCIALLCVMLAQGAVANLDRLQHDLGVQHAPNAFAGAVHLDHHALADHHLDADHDHGEEDDASGGEHSGPLGHNHHTDGGQTLLVVAEPTDFPPAVRANVVGLSAYEGRPLLVGARLDRPPKPESVSVA